ncbi:MAG: hypothetical protein GKR94_02335 [Gammaproteobacteria bacterium]|nr:hypothetical protein [Gammaproteobacteria bacterium]
MVSNAVDEFLAGAATKVSIEIKDGLLDVEDDGRGLPFGHL